MKWKERYQQVQRGIQDRLGKCALLLCLALLVYGSFFTVNQGVRGVVLRFGEVQYVAEPGFHLKAPIIDSVVRMSVRTQKEKITLQVYSKDIQAAEARISLNFSLSPAFVSSIYEKYGESYLERIIVPQLMAQPKDVFRQIQCCGYCPES